MPTPPRQSRREARAERQNLKAANEQKQKVRLLDRLAPATENIPRTAAAPAAGPNKPRIAVNPSSIFELKMTWCTTKSDLEGYWTWGQPRQWADEEYSSHIQATLDALTNSTWKEIRQMLAGGLAKHHDQDVASIVPEAQDRWSALDIQTDTAFRFRLTGKQRAWGFREGAHFKLVWYDKFHKIYPVEKGHT